MTDLLTILLIGHCPLFALWPEKLACVSSSDNDICHSQRGCLPCLFSCVRVIMLPSSAKPFSKFSTICWRVGAHFFTSTDVCIMSYNLHINSKILPHLAVYTQKHFSICGYCAFLWVCGFIVWTVQSMHIWMLIQRLYVCTNSEAHRSEIVQAV